MRTKKKHLGTLLFRVLCLASFSVCAADPGSVAVDDTVRPVPGNDTATDSRVDSTAGTGEARWSGSITPRLVLFDYFYLSREHATPYVERYDVQKSISGDTRSGSYPDVDVDLTYGDDRRDLFILERRGFGQYNHRGRALYSDDGFSASASYRRYRSIPGAIDFQSMFGARGGPQGPPNGP